MSESSQRFVLKFTPEAAETIAELRASKQHRAKAKKVAKALRSLQEHGPEYPALRTHRYKSVFGPDDQTVYQSYVENRTPGAWRVWWWYGPGNNEITIMMLGKHP